MIDTQAIKNKILGLAIQGNLTDQRPEDGTAEELLEQICVEKKRLIAEGKIKHEKKLPPISEEEIPFDIPENWRWVRLGECFSVTMGQSPDGQFINTSDGIEFHQGKIFFGNRYIKDSKTKTSVPSKIAKAGSVLLCVRAPVGKVNITDREICIGRGLAAIKCYCEMPTLFLFFLLQCFEEKFNAEATGSTFKAITIEKVRNQLIPLPPLAEQERIVERIEQAFSVLDTIDELQAGYEKNQNVLKNKLLELAIHGNLTDQRPEDGTAEELLERIRAEKKRLIAEGKIKREKALPPITEDEKPFDIPDNWCWVRLGEISTYGKSTAKIKAKNINKDAWILDLEDIKKSGRIIKRRKAEELKSKGDKNVFYQDDILYSKLRPYLLKILLAPSEGFCTTELVPFRCYGKINHEYIINFLKSSYTDNTVNKATYGIKMPRVGKDTMLNLLVPLPPLAEQERIVERLNELLPLCERMK